MQSLYGLYRNIHDQGFIPIFADDTLDPRPLVEACVAAGLRVIEYTLRCADAPAMIPWIRRQYPHLHILVGSTLDNDRIVNAMRQKHPSLLTIKEAAARGADGFVSMIGWRLSSLRCWTRTHIVMPSAMTPTEALQQTGAGAHFIKFLGTDLALVARCRAQPTFGFCPVMVTGGMTRDRIPAAIQAGAVLIGTGFDLMLKTNRRPPSIRHVTTVLKAYQTAVQTARRRVFPDLARAEGASRAAWLAALPHYHPFGA